MTYERHTVWETIRELSLGELDRGITLRLPHRNVGRIRTLSVPSTPLLGTDFSVSTINCLWDPKVCGFGSGVLKRRVQDYSWRHEGEEILSRSG